MHTHNPSLPYFSVKPTSIALYHQKAYPSTHYEGGEVIRKKPKSNTAGRFLSAKAQKRLKLAVNWLYELSEPKKIYHEQKRVYFSFRLNFITLTLPCLQMHLDTTIKKTAFNSFLTYMREYYSLNNYVWRCECQSNGNIHFHIVTDTYINYKTVRNSWNRQLKKLGYIKKYQEKWKGVSFKNYCKEIDPSGKKDLSKLLSAWKYGEKTNWLDPNTTDIHSLYNIDNPAAYISKYMSKGESPIDEDGRYNLKQRKIKGRNWGLSQKLGRLKGYVGIRNDIIEQVIDYVEKLKSSRIVVENYYKVIFTRFKDWKAKFNNLYKSIIAEMIEKVEYVAGGYSRQKIRII